MGQGVGVRAMKRERWVRVGFGVLCVVVLVAAQALRPGMSGRIVPVSERRAMPPLELTQLGGGTWRLAEHRGDVVLVNYWATWCQPCWEETPGLIRLAQGTKGLAVVGISLDEGEGVQAKVAKFVREFGVPYPVAFPRKMSQMAYGMTGVPVTILLDKQGRVAKMYEGAVRERDFKKDVGVLLGE